MDNTNTELEATGAADKRPFHEMIAIGDISVGTHVHADGMVSLSFTKYSTPAGRYSASGFQFTAADLTAIVALLSKTVAAVETR